MSSPHNHPFGSNVFRGVWLVAAMVGVSALSTCVAHAEALPRTVSWFADHPAAMAQTLAVCREDPGRLRRHPDCINAYQAQSRVALRAGAVPTRTARSGDLTSPETPRYWRERPDERAQKIAFCGRMSPADQARNYCAAARAAEARLP